MSYVANPGCGVGGGGGGGGGGGVDIPGRPAIAAGFATGAAAAACKSSGVSVEDCPFLRLRDCKEPAPLPYDPVVLLVDLDIAIIQSPVNAASSCLWSCTANAPA